MAVVLASLLACQRLRWGADHQPLAGGLDHLLGDRAQSVDLQDARDLGEQPLHQPEVAAGDPRDRRQRLGVGVIVRRKRQPDLPPFVGEDEAQLLFAQGPIVVDEPDPRVELGVAGQPLLDPGQADQDQPHPPPLVRPVVEVAQLLQRRLLQAVGLSTISSSTDRDGAGGSTAPSSGWAAAATTASKTRQRVDRASVSRRDVVITLGV